MTSRPAPGANAPLKAWMEWLESLDPSRIEMGLDRTRQVLDRLFLRVPSVPVITVAGTNGKGSTLAYLDSIYRAAGYRTGLTTSPHLIDVSERVRVSGVQITQQQLADCLHAVDCGRGEIPLSYFEYLVVAALYWFKQSEVDVVLLEVGLGGRLDAVNCVDASLAIVTSIGVDHVAWLGDDTSQIAREKAAICRADRPIVLADDSIPISADQLANEHGANVCRLGQDYSFSLVDTVFSVDIAGVSQDFPLPAITSVPLSNAAAAVVSVSQLQPLLPLSGADVSLGLQTARLPGRGQSMSVRWLGRDLTVVFDVAHNSASSEVLASALARLPEKPHALCAMLSDKDSRAVYAALSEHFSRWQLAGLEGPRGQSAAQLMDKMGCPACACHSSVEAAMPLALSQLVADNCTTLFVFGSFETVGKAIVWCREQGYSIEI